MLTRLDRTCGVFAAAVCLCAAGLVVQASAIETPPPSHEAKGLRVLILSGSGGHDWRASTDLLRKALVASGRFEVRVCEASDGLKGLTLTDFDVLVDVSGRSAACHDPEGEISRFVEAGKGLVITHGALAEAEPETTNRGCWPLISRGGPHPGVRFQDVRIVKPDQLITRGIPARFKIADAFPAGLAVQSGAEVIATASDETRDGGSSEEPVLVAMHHGKGRVFCTAMGHDPGAMMEPTFLATFAGDRMGGDRGGDFAHGRRAFPAPRRCSQGDRDHGRP